jgi:hypothetical protein
MSGVSVCRQCGAPIEFVKLDTGKVVAVDSTRRTIVVTDEGKMVVGRMPHRSTCRYAEQRSEGPQQ